MKMFFSFFLFWTLSILLVPFNAHATEFEPTYYVVNTEYGEIRDYTQQEVLSVVGSTISSRLQCKGVYPNCDELIAFSTSDLVTELAFPEPENSVGFNNPPSFDWAASYVDSEYWSLYCDGDSYDGNCLLFKASFDGTIWSGGHYSGYADPIPPVAPFYSQIKNINAASSTLHSNANATSSILKTLPQDWIVYVSSTTDVVGDPILNNDFYWYQVVDPSDGVSGWMKGANASGSIEHLSYNLIDQAEFSSTSSVFVATSSRPQIILDAIDHYYNNASTSYSLYSSDDGSNAISEIRGRDFEKKIIWGIAAQETGPFGFRNEIVSYDYGHGIMQITFSPSQGWDNRGIGSFIKIPPCSLENLLYLNCYTGPDTLHLRHYKPYADDPYNFTYKQYTDTIQSIYANIKDGLKKIQYALRATNFSGSKIISGVVYSELDRETLIATARYNGNGITNCTYIGGVANKLNNIDSFFPGETTGDISDLKHKMSLMGAAPTTCAQLHSPGDLSIHDSKGNVVGVINGKEKNDFPLAYHDEDRKFAQVFFADDQSYVYKVDGTGTGKYGLTIKVLNNENPVEFKAYSIPIVPTEIHTYRVDTEKILSKEDGVTVEIDNNKDGLIDSMFSVGETLTALEFSEKRSKSLNE